VADKLLQAFAAARPHAASVAEATLEVTLLRAAKLLQRCDGTGGQTLLTPLAKRRGVPLKIRLPALNVLGCCRYLTKDHTGAAKAFAAAIELDAQDPLLHQNMALLCELRAEIRKRPEEDMRLAQLAWNHYLDLLNDRLPAPPGQALYWEDVKFECLCRLARRSAEAAQPTTAADYLEQAHALRPNDLDIAEKLFHVYNELQRFDEAKEMLLCLNALREQTLEAEIIDLDENHEAPSDAAASKDA
jgi:hypothetical protein